MLHGLFWCDDTSLLWTGGALGVLFGLYECLAAKRLLLEISWSMLTTNHLYAYTCISKDR